MARLAFVWLGLALTAQRMYYFNSSATGDGPMESLLSSYRLAHFKTEVYRCKQYVSDGCTRLGKG